MKTRNIVLIVLLLIIIAGAYVGYKWFNRKKEDPYATFIKPRLELTTYEIKTMTKEKTDMNMIMVIDNPAPVSFTAKDLSYKIYISDTEVMKGTYPKTVTLKKGDNSTVSLPVTSYNEKLIKTLKKLEDKRLDSVEYRIVGQFYTDLPFLKDKPIDFDIKKKGPLIMIPKAKVIKTKIEKLGLNETNLLVESEIYNPNVFPFKFKDTFYRIRINNDKVAEGKIDSAIIIPSKGKAILKLPMKLNIKEVGEAVLGLIAKPKDENYSFYFETKMISEDRSLKDSKMITEDEGKLKDLIKQNR